MKKKYSVVVSLILFNFILASWSHAKTPAETKRLHKLRKIFRKSLTAPTDIDFENLKPWSTWKCTFHGARPFQSLRVPDRKLSFFSQDGFYYLKGTDLPSYSIYSIVNRVVPDDTKPNRAFFKSVLEDGKGQYYMRISPHGSLLIEWVKGLHHDDQVYQSLKSIPSTPSVSVTIDPNIKTMFRWQSILGLSGKQSPRSPDQNLDPITRYAVDTEKSSNVWLKSISGSNFGVVGYYYCNIKDVNTSILQLVRKSTSGLFDQRISVSEPSSHRYEPIQPEEDFWHDD